MGLTLFCLSSSAIPVTITYNPDVLQLNVNIPTSKHDYFSFLQRSILSLLQVKPILHKLLWSTLPYILQSLPRKHPQRQLSIQVCCSTLNCPNLSVEEINAISYLPSQP